MSRADEPAGWAGDPAVEAGFAAAYATPDMAVLSRATTEQDEQDLRADLAARRVMVDGRRVRATEPGRLPPGRAVAGALVSVAGVCLGIGTLLWVSDDPSRGPGPALVRPDAAVAPGLAPGVAPGLASAPAETELAPVDPPAPAPVAVAPSAPVPVPAAASAPSSAAPVRSVVPITVLNNSNRTGLADRAARRFQRGGWPVRLTGNFRGQIPVTTVYYDPGLEASARAFAADFAGIVRVRPRFATLPARGVVVVLTREFAVS